MEYYPALRKSRMNLDITIIIIIMPKLFGSLAVKTHIYLSPADLSGTVWQCKIIIEKPDLKICDGFCDLGSLYKMNNKVPKYPVGPN